MADERSENSPYPSKYSPTKWVSAAQYIIELVCERRAKAIKIEGELPIQFWHLPEWAQYFTSQLRATHKLLSKFSPDVIITVIKRNNIWSLRPKWIVPLFEAEQKKYDLQQQRIIESNRAIEAVDNTLPLNRTETNITSNVRSKLLDLDNI